MMESSTPFVTAVLLIVGEFDWEGLRGSSEDKKKGAPPSPKELLIPHLVSTPHRLLADGSILEPPITITNSVPKSVNGGPCAAWCYDSIS
jgi:hypothetical protein